MRGAKTCVKAVCYIYDIFFVQLKHIFLVNCGGNLNILEMLEPEEDVMFYIADRYLKKGISPMGVLQISSEGNDQQNFLGLKFLNCGVFFWVGKFGKYVFGWLDLSRDFLGIQNNLRFVVVSTFLGCIHVVLRKKYN